VALASTTYPSRRHDRTGAPARVKIKYGTIRKERAVVYDYLRDAYAKIGRKVEEAKIRRVKEATSTPTVPFDISSIISQLAQKLNIPQEKLSDFTAKASAYVNAENAGFVTTGGEQFSDLVEAVKAAQGAVTERVAVIVVAESFKSPVTYSTVLETLRLAGDNFKLGIFGEGAANLRIMLGGSDNIITAETHAEVGRELVERLGIKPSNIKFVRAGNTPTITMAATLRALYDLPEVNNAFEDFYKGTVAAGVIDQETYNRTVIEMRKNMTSAALSDQIEAVELPKIELIAAAQTVIDAERQTVADFITSIAE
jgi:hypothetical protein